MTTASSPTREQSDLTFALAHAARERRKRAARYLADPVAFSTDRLKAHLWSKQREIIESVRENRHTAVHSCHASGKSFCAACVVAWWIECHPPGEAFVVTTAPTFAQVKHILWREIGRAHARGKLTGRTNQTEWYAPVGDREEIVAFGRKPSDYDEAAFQGIHADAVLVVMDEAAGIPEALWAAVETITTSEDSRILAIGNPDDPSSKFASICGPASGWHTIHIDAYDTPNFTGEEVPESLRRSLTSKLWVDERREEWGEESPLFQAKVRGVFPEEAADGVIPLSFIRRCQTSEDAPEPEKDDIVELGVDVGAGGDETVIYERRGSRVGRNWHFRTPDFANAVGHVVNAIRDTGATAVKVDVIGIGWGVVGRLKEQQALHKARVVPVNVGEASTDTSRFPKLRDEIWWDVGRELSRTRGWDLTGLDETTVAQLIAPKYSLDSAGRVKVEPKDETRKRLGRSPDLADALLLAFYQDRRSFVPRVAVL